MNISSIKTQTAKHFVQYYHAIHSILASDTMHTVAYAVVRYSRGLSATAEFLVFT